MKVVLVNGSPNEKGCTYTALKEMADEFGRQGVETEIVHIGKAAIHGCIGCGYCRKAGRCVFDDAVNALAEKLVESGVLRGHFRPAEMLYGPAVLQPGCASGRQARRRGGQRAARRMRYHLR